jgi:hypothetical protein
MSGRIGRYTYKNNTVLREFLGALGRALGKRGGNKVLDKVRKDPEMARLIKAMEKDAKKVHTKAQKQRKKDPELDRLLKLAGI